jgi:hypothetical protein
MVAVSTVMSPFVLVWSVISLAFVAQVRPTLAWTLSRSSPGRTSLSLSANNHPTDRLTFVRRIRERLFRRDDPFATSSDCYMGPAVAAGRNKAVDATIQRQKSPDIPSPPKQQRSKALSSMISSVPGRFNIKRMVSSALGRLAASRSNDSLRPSRRKGHAVSCRMAAAVLACFALGLSWRPSAALAGGGMALSSGPVVPLERCVCTSFWYRYACYVGYEVTLTCCFAHSHLHRILYLFI